MSNSLRRPYRHTRWRVAAYDIARSENRIWGVLYCEEDVEEVTDMKVAGKLPRLPFVRYNYVDDDGTTSYHAPFHNLNHNRILIPRRRSRQYEARIRERGVRFIGEL